MQPPAASASPLPSVPPKQRGALSRKYPAVVMVYDEKAGDYAERQGGICMARWSGSNLDHESGELCARTATNWIGDVEFCAYHYRRAISDCRREAIGSHRKTQIEIAAAATETARLQEEAERLAAEKRGIVYYLYRPGDRMIKIGTTANWARRLEDHRRDHGGELLLMLAHAGGRKTEGEMHAKFKAFRPGPPEWFLPGKPLIRWIRRQRAAANGRPNALPEQMPIDDVRKLLRKLEANAAEPLAPRVKPVVLATPAVRDHPIRVPEAQLWCTREQAAEYLGLSLQELAAWRASGDGPTHIEWGKKVRYECSALPGWAAEHAASPEAADPAA